MADDGYKWIERARILVNQSRWREAEAELGQALAGQGGDRALALYWLAWAQLGQDKLDQALTTAGRAIAEDPEMPGGYHARAVVLRKKGDVAAGEAAARAAVEKDSQTTEYRAELAWNLLIQARAQEALDVVDYGLSNHAEAVNLHRARTEALIQLGQLPAARDSAKHALSLDAEDSTSMAQLGALAYKERDLAAAEKHFAEALRIRPGYDYARQYLLKTVKERIWFYRFLVPKSGGTNRMNRVALVAGFAIGALHSISSGSAVTGAVMLLLVALVSVRLYAISLANPIFAAQLRMNPIGRALLSRDTIECSNCVGLMLLGACAAFGLAFVGVWPRGFVAVGSILVLLPIPLSRAFEGTRRRRLIANVYADLVAVIGVLSVLGFYLGAAEQAMWLLLACALGSAVTVPVLAVLARLFRA